MSTAVARPGAGASVQAWLQAIGFFRGFLLITFMPAAVAALAVYHETHLFSLARFVWLVIGAWALHVGTNLMNEAEDARTGVDLNNPVNTPFSGGTHVVEEGKLTPDALHRAALAAFAVGLVVFAGFIPVAGLAAFAAAALGGVLGYAYTASPFRLCYRGFGELTVGVVDGPLIALTVSLVQAGRVSPAAMATGLVLGLLSAAILTMNEFPDIIADARCDKRNLVVRLGLARAAVLHGALMCCAFLALLACVAARVLPPATLLGLLGLAAAIPVLRLPKTNLDNIPALTRACGGTIRTQVVTWALMCLGLTIAIWRGGAA